MDEKSQNEDYFRNLIGVLRQIKEDLMCGGRARHASEISPSLFKEFWVIFNQTMQAGEEFFEIVNWPKTQEELEKERRRKEREEANRIDPLTESQYVEAVRLGKKGLSLSKIARYQGIDENEYRKRHIKSAELYGMTQAIIDRVNVPPVAEQDLVLEARSSNTFGKPELVFLEIQPVRVLLNKGMKPKEVAEKLNLNPDSLKSWIKANKKYLEL